MGKASCELADENRHSKTTATLSLELVIQAKGDATGVSVMRRTRHQVIPRGHSWAIVSLT